MTPGDRFKLGARDVHVWSVWTEAPDSVVASLRSVLSPAETDRAARFHFERHRRAYIIRHGVLRILLSNYMGIAARDLQFECDDKGKPVIGSPIGIDFNTSRTEALGAFAFTILCEIGIDVERIRPIPEIHDIAKRFFCREEAAELLALPADAQEIGFHQCWTRKEAYLKAIGEGLSAPLDQFRVTLRPGEPARFVEFMQYPHLAREWALHNLLLAPAYAAALAYRGSERAITVFPVLEAGKVLSNDFDGPSATP